MTSKVPRMGDTEPSPTEQGEKRPFWRRRWFAVVAAIWLLLVVVGLLSALGEDSGEERAGSGQASPTATADPSPTPDPLDEARGEASRLADVGRYEAAVGVLEDAGLDEEAGRIRSRGARSLYRRARRALASGEYPEARELAVEARRLRSTTAIAELIADADEGIAAARAAARERRRAARLARDLRTCTVGEKDTVQVGGGVPAGCETYAADLAARRAERATREQAEQEQEQESAGAGCAPGYSPCIPSFPPDLDCPDVGPVAVSGSDPHGLDADGDGVACGGD